MFRNLIPKLTGGFHFVAPDYVGFGLSSAPSADEFEYTFKFFQSGLQILAYPQKHINTLVVSNEIKQLT
ncbi:hypothetical protein BJV82DRAFT_620363 [Fennellomyces sp. T-0311]|nr:hypothetical protein BJV82DRAFT_620363 [Fennellomyces sp. T-0311]